MFIIRKHCVLLKHFSVLKNAKFMSCNVSELPPVSKHINDNFDEDAGKQISILSPDSGKQFDLSTFAPELVPTFNLAAYANRSPNLQKWIDLGVDLSKLEKKKGIPQFLLRLDFERDMKNHIQFLHDVGVPADNLGHFLTKNPLIFKEELETLRTRVDFLHSIQFSPAMVARIMTANPYWLMFSTERIEKRLERFQELFSVGAQTIRGMVCREPRLFTYNMLHVQAATFSVKEEMGFSKEETRSMVLAKPKIWMISNPKLVERFHLVHNEMKVPHDVIAQQPQVLLCRTHRTRQRHLFLESRGRAQYVPSLPNYVSLDSLTNGTDAEFALDVAGTSLYVFNDFLKTL